MLVNSMRHSSIADTEDKTLPNHHIVLECAYSNEGSAASSESAIMLTVMPNEVMKLLLEIN